MGEEKNSGGTKNAGKLRNKKTKNLGNSEKINVREKIKEYKWKRTEKSVWRQKEQEKIGALTCKKEKYINWRRTGQKDGIKCKEELWEGRRMFLEKTQQTIEQMGEWK